MNADSMSADKSTSSARNQRCCETGESVDWLPFAGGAALVLLALTNRSKLLGLGALLGGGYLLKRAIDNGTIQIPPDLIENVKSQVAQFGESMGLGAEAPYDVDEASEESFPASDPPARY